MFSQLAIPAAQRLNPPPPPPDCLSACSLIAYLLIRFSLFVLIFIEERMMDDGVAKDSKVPKDSRF
jgi:hypothetical protein